MTAQPSKAAKPATHEDANLLLRLYELRREEKAAWRETTKNPKFARNLETVANVMMEEENRVGSHEAFQKIVRGIRA